MLSDRCLSCLSVMLVYCGQTVGWIKMPLGTEVGLGPQHCVRWRPSSSPTERGTAAPLHFSAHVYCGQTVAHLNSCWALVSTSKRFLYNISGNPFDYSNAILAGCASRLLLRYYSPVCLLGIQELEWPRKPLNLPGRPMWWSQTPITSLVVNTSLKAIDGEWRVKHQNQPANETSSEFAWYSCQKLAISSSNPWHKTLEATNHTLSNK